MATNYYDILEIPSDSKEKEIKKAYVLKLRQYPNERFPEEFKEIRKAYEILSNEKSRNEYDTLAVYGEEIDQLQAKANAAVEKENFQEAINYYKKMLIIAPSLLYIRNHYALALIYNEEYDKAIKQLEKLISLEKENATYLYNLGFAYKRKGEYQQAIHYLTKAFELDPNDVNIIFALSDIYMIENNFTQARRTINDVLLQNSNEGFHQFMYLFRHLQIDIFAKDSAIIKDTLNRIEDLLVNHPEEKSYVAAEFGKFALELFDNKQYEWAYYLTEKGIELDSDNSLLSELHEETKQNKLIYQEFEYLENDERVIMPLRFNLFLYLFGNEYAEEEFESNLDTMYKNLELSCKYEPEETLNSIKRLSIKYPNLYMLREEVLLNAKEMAEESRKTNEQYEKMRGDDRITNSLKRLIALYLSETGEEERRDYFKDIMDEMSYEQEYSIKSSVERLQSFYPALFSLNSEFLLDIKKKLNESSHSTTHDKAGTVNSYSRNDNSSTTSCFVATAAFGSPLSAELDYLRFWRDNHLNQNFFGKRFIVTYYKIGPLLAMPVRKYRWLQRFFQKVIYKIIRQIDERYDLINEFHRRDLFKERNRQID